MFFYFYGGKSEIQPSITAVGVLAHLCAREYPSAIGGARRQTSGGLGLRMRRRARVSALPLHTHSLLENVCQTSSHFIRCIKPSDSQQPRDFNGPKVLSQLRYAPPHLR